MMKKNLVIISEQYLAFVKDQVECLSDNFDHIFVFVRYNPLATLTSFLSIGSIRNYQKKNRIDQTNIRDNIHIFLIPLLYRNLGNVYFRIVDRIIQRNNIQFDLIHAHFTYPSGFVGSKLRRKYGVPLIITAHGYDIYDLPFRNVKWRRKIKAVLDNADRLITVSNRNLDCIKQLDIRTPVSMIPNGYQKDLFYPMNMIKCRTILNLPIDKKIILSVGNLVTVKGYHYLIRAIKKIIFDGSDVLCIIVGGGELEKSLQDEIKSLNLEKNIRLIGRQPHNKINLWMNACDLFVLPSLSESFGVVQIEALACGKPVVATRNGGSEEVITSDEYGYLVESADPESLAEMILVALERNWDQKVILRYAEHFEWENIVEEIMDVYSQAVY